MTEIEALKKRVALHYKDAVESAVLASSYNEEVKALRAFAQDIMSYWPDGDLDGGDLQEIAEKHGLLKLETRYEPCGESCKCSEYANAFEWKDGVTCYRKTNLLIGEY